MKKKAYKTPKGGTFRTYFHGNRKTNGCTFRKVAKAKEVRNEVHWVQEKTRLPVSLLPKERLGEKAEEKEAQSA